MKLWIKIIFSIQLQQWKHPKGLEYSKVSFCLIVLCKTIPATREKIKQRIPNSLLNIEEIHTTCNSYINRDEALDRCAQKLNRVEEGALEFVIREEHI